jgi:hypothetical protein
MIMTKAEITGFTLHKNNKEIITEAAVFYEPPVTYYFWDLFNIPKKAGVYIVYDVAGDCLYVGSTPYRYNLNKRISEHLSKANFRHYGYKIFFFETLEDTTEILLLEKLFTKALENPPFNKERNSISLSKTGFEYLSKYKNIRNHYNWQNYYEREARGAGVPISIVELRDKIEDKYNFLEDLPLFRGEVNLISLFNNMKKSLEKIKKTEPSETFEGWVKRIMNFIDQDALNDETVTKIVLNNKQYKKHLKDKKKRKKAKGF